MDNNENKVRNTLTRLGIPTTNLTWNGLHWRVSTELFTLTLQEDLVPKQLLIKHKLDCYINTLSNTSGLVSHRYNKITGKFTLANVLAILRKEQCLH